MSYCSQNNWFFCLTAKGAIWYTYSRGKIVMNRQELIRQTLEDLELLNICSLIIERETLYPYKSEIGEIFEKAQNKRGYLSPFYKIQEQETGEIYE